MAMFKYLKRPGTEENSLPRPPPVKLNRKEEYTVYETKKRQRKFMDSQKVGRPWLSNDGGDMKCKVCVDFNEKGGASMPSKAFSFDT